MTQYMNIARKYEAYALFVLAGPAMDSILGDRGIPLGSEYVALHEAAHAIVLWERGGWPEKITIEADGSVAGYVKPMCFGTVEPPAAQPIAALVEETPASTRETDASRALVALFPSFVRKPYDDERLALAYAVKSVGGWQGSREFLRVKRYEARQLLLCRWNTVIRLGSELLKHRRLDAIDFALFLESECERRVLELQART